MNLRFDPNTLYYGDCLDIMSNFPEDAVDLICLDPPFNSNRTYNTIFKGSGLRNIDPQIKAFDDIWDWDDASAERVERVKSAIANPASKVIQAFDLCIPKSKMLSYTSYMAERLFEMHRILKSTGSIYLHCDPYASHYLKLVMDAIFGIKNFRNEIIWFYRKFGQGGKNFKSNHDVLLYYGGDQCVFNQLYEKFSPKTHKDKYKRVLVDGKWTQDKNTLMKDIRKHDGVAMGNVWEVSLIHSQAKERLGYPTQKPLALYERIIKASSNPNHIVLDPFCGCGTTIEAAKKHNRYAIGIDILPFALELVNNYRLKPNGFPTMPILGVPVDAPTAYQLADTAPLKFQDWAVSLIDGFAANPKKTADDGIDGFGMMRDKPDNMEQRAILVQVTGAKGQQKSKYERLQTTIRNHNAAMGILITRDAQTAQKRWQHQLPPIEMGISTYAPIQCFSIEEYYSCGKRWDVLLRLPPLTNPWTGKPMQASLFDAV